VYIPNSNELAIELIETYKKRHPFDAKYTVLDCDTQNGQIPVQLFQEIPKWDWIHIDAGHEIEEAVKDMLSFWPYVGKVMTVHDYSSHPPVKQAVDMVLYNNLLPGLKCHFHVISSHGFYLLGKE